MKYSTTDVLKVNIKYFIYACFKSINIKYFVKCCKTGANERSNMYLDVSGRSSWEVN